MPPEPGQPASILVRRRQSPTDPEPQHGFHREFDDAVVRVDDRRGKRPQQPAKQRQEDLSGKLSSNYQRARNDQALQGNSPVRIEIDGHVTIIAQAKDSSRSEPQFGRDGDSTIRQSIETNDPSRPGSIAEANSELIDRPSRTEFIQDAEEQVQAFRGNMFQPPSQFDSQAKAVSREDSSTYAPSTVEDGGFKYRQLQTTRDGQHEGQSLVLQEEDVESNSSSDSDSDETNDASLLEGELLTVTERTLRLSDEKVDKFIPWGELIRVVNEDSVFRELNQPRVLGKSHGPKKLKAMAREICGISQNPLVDGLISKPISFRAIFAILVLMGESSAISKFIEDNVSDVDLPLEMEEAKKTGRIHLKRWDSSQKRLRSVKCVRGWLSARRDQFYAYQWKVVAPYLFFTHSDTRSIKHFKLKQDHILPFVFAEEQKTIPRIGGGYGTVFLVDIHRDHHTFDRTGAKDLGFAVKKLDRNPSGDFPITKEESIQEEVRALRRFSGAVNHTHVVPLLATLEQGSSYYLLFYRADGDLLKLWTEIKRSPRCDHALILWVARQCTGLADALHLFHNPIPHQSTFPVWRRKQYARHHSISERYFSVKLPSPVQGKAAAEELRSLDHCETKGSPRRWSCDMPRPASIHPSQIMGGEYGYRGVTGAVDDEGDDARSVDPRLSPDPPDGERMKLSEEGTGRSPSDAASTRTGGLQAQIETGGKQQKREEFRIRKPIGRHFDVKPKNILWFRDKEGHKGTLKLADFGQAELSAKLTRSKPRDGFAFTSTYRAPECENKNAKLRPSYDVWCLGCVFLEFVAWVLGGADLVESFAEKREKAEGSTRLLSDTFFEVLSNKAEPEATEKPEAIGKPTVIVKEEVTEFIKELHANPACSDYMHDFLDVIEEYMLVVDTTRRGTSRRVHAILNDLIEKCEKDEQYAARGNPWAAEVDRRTVARSAPRNLHLEIPQATRWQPFANPIPREVRRWESEC